MILADCLELDVTVIQYVEVYYVNSYHLTEAINHHEILAE